LSKLVLLVCVLFTIVVVIAGLAVDASRGGGCRWDLTAPGIKS
jgi:hypothetical protein